MAIRVVSLIKLFTSLSPLFLRTPTLGVHPHLLGIFQAETGEVIYLGRSGTIPHPVLAAKPSAPPVPHPLWLPVPTCLPDDYEKWLTKEVKKEKGKY